jgi:hypothetical protein
VGQAPILIAAEPMSTPRNAAIPISGMHCKKIVRTIRVGKKAASPDLQETHHSD